MTWVNLTAEIREEFARYAGVDFFAQACELVRRHCGGAGFRRFGFDREAHARRTREWKRRERANNPDFRAREARHAREYRRRKVAA